MTLLSILTPTYERHAFLPYLARMIQRQTVPLTDIEWIVVDDSASSLHEWFADHPLQTSLQRVCYVHLPHKEPIGCKRNLTKTLAHGDYLIHMDDDDYYAPNYIDTVLQRFQATDKPDIVGATTICLMYPDSLFLQQSGPFHPKHTCGGAMSYTRKYANQHHFRNHAKKAEEPFFIDNHPVAQILNAHNVYMAFVHLRNTVPKHKVSRRKVDLRWLDVVQHPDVLMFYLSLHAADIPWDEELPNNTIKHTGHHANDDPDTVLRHTVVPGSRVAYGYSFYALTVLDGLKRMVGELVRVGRMERPGEGTYGEDRVLSGS